MVSVDWIFFGLAASCVFVLRRRDAASSGSIAYRIPGHPVTTASFVVVSAVMVLNTVYKYPANSAIGLGILLSGIPAYGLWKRRSSGV